jgi:hypothetical protein
MVATTTPMAILANRRTLRIPKHLSISTDHSSSLRVKSSYILIILLLCFSSFFTVRWITADIIISSAKQDFDEWNSLGGVPSLQVWEATQVKIIKALALNKKDAELHQLNGLLFEWKNFIVDGSIDREQQTEARQKAIAAYRRSTALRPAWPDAWAQLARQKASLRQYDQEFILAMERSLSLGKQESRIQLLVTETASLAWPFLSVQNEVSTDIISNIQYGLSQENFDQHTRFLNDRGLLSFFCALTGNQNYRTEVRTACQQVD